jgi:hypothetical protein
LNDQITDDGEFDHIGTAPQLGDLLRNLRGRRTQQNIADHAKRANLYLHRPDVSTIERGRRLPTQNELRGFLHACDRADLIEPLNEVRSRLQEDSLNQPVRSEELKPQSEHLISDEPGSTVAADGDQPVAGHRRLAALAVGAAVVLVMLTALVIASDRYRQPTADVQGPASSPTSPHSTTSADQRALARPATSYAPDGAGRTLYETNTNHYTIYDIKGDHRAVAVYLDRPNGDLIGFQSCHEGSGNDCPGDLPGSVTGPLCMKMGVGLGPHPAGYIWGPRVCVPNA